MLIISWPVNIIYCNNNATNIIAELLELYYMFVVMMMMMIMMMKRIKRRAVVVVSRAGPSPLTAQAFPLARWLLAVG